MRINTNVASMTAQESAVNVGKQLTSSLEKLSTGLRINKASDDASGMAIADKLRTQASSIGQGISNANAANSFIQIADKAMGEQSNILDIVKTKLIQASTSTTSDDGREAILNDIQALLSQFDSISNSTNYNGTMLLDGTENFEFQIGEEDTSQVTVARDTAILTTSMGGGSATITDGTKLTEGEGISVQDDTSVIVTASNAGDALQVNGKAGTITSETGTVLTGLDDLTKSLINAAGGTNGSISMATDTSLSINFGDNTVSFTAEISAETDALVMTTTESLTLNATDSLATAKLEVSSGTGADLLTGGDLLSNLDAATVLTADDALSYLATVDEALTQLNTARSAFGSGQNQVESALRNMMTTQTNLEAAESIIRDVDYASESANFNKQNIIAQAGTYAISQANQVQQNVLKLLQ